jgi:hypothetical protein
MPVMHFYSGPPLHLLSGVDILPSCALCNQARGKMNHFPVGAGHAHTPTESLSDEHPLLLNPYNLAVDPLEHLEFSGLGKALAHNESLYGEASRTFYHLNRPGLSEARHIALAKVRQDWLVLTAILSSLVALDAVVKEVSVGRREYSAAQLWELKRIQNGGIGDL